MAKKNNQTPKPKTRTEECQNRQGQKGRTTPLPSSQLDNKPKKKD